MITGAIGIFAVGLFGVPIGIFESGFVAWAKEMGEDLDDDDDDDDDDEEEEEEGEGDDAEVASGAAAAADAAAAAGVVDYQSGSGGFILFTVTFHANSC